MKIRDKLNLMRKIEETNRVNVARWKQAIEGSVVGYVIDPVAGSTEGVRFFAEDLPVLFEADKDDIQQMDLMIETTRLTVLFREIPGKPVSLIGYNCSMTGTVVIVRRDGERFVDLTVDDVKVIRRNLDTVYGLGGYPHKVLCGCSF